MAPELNLSDTERQIVEAYLAQNEREDLGPWTIEELSPQEILEILDAAKSRVEK